MPPSESGQSSSSFGSALGDSEHGSQRLEPVKDDADPLSEGQHGVEDGVFGCLYTVSKEKHPSLAFVAFRLFLDWLQLFLIIVNPAYGWNIPANNRVWQVFSFIQLNQFMEARGYTFFIVIMYIAAAALACNVALSVWVSHSFQQNKFEYVWPIVWLRYFSLIFYQVLDVASLTFFLITLDCGYFGLDEASRGVNQEFGTACWSMPHLAHASIAAISLVVFVCMAAIFTMSEIELNPISRNLLGMAHTKVEVTAFLVKTIMTCATVFINSLKWMCIIELACAAYLTYLYCYWAPHLHSTVNYIRTGYNASVFYASLLLVLVVYMPGIDPDVTEDVDNYRRSLTNAMWGGFGPAFLIGAAASYMRVRHFMVKVVGRFRDAAHGTKAKHIWKFNDPREVEIVSRCCRQWVEEDKLDDDAVKLAERVIKAGMALLPNNAYMIIWYSSFLIDVQGSYQSGYLELQAAKKSNNQSFLERFCIFIREQEHTQKASAATSGENANVDLVSYVEFQRNYRLAMRLHMDALQAKRLFWEVLLHQNCNFDKLAKAVGRIEFTVRAAERMYKQVLSRHGSSVKILLLWVKFLQSVKNDPWSAARWMAEAEKLQKAEEEANERAVFGNHGEGTSVPESMQNHDDSKGIIIMGANCLVKMVNESAAGMLGFSSKTELVGKNINLIVPPPFARNHNNYVRNYIQTGKAKILDHLREFVALHKDRYVVPINVFVTKVSGIGEDSTFLGMFTKIAPRSHTAMAWIMNGGLVLSVDGTFTDWLGYKQEDVHARPLSDLVVDSDQIEDLFLLIKAEMSNSNGAKSKQSAAGVGAQLLADLAKKVSAAGPGPGQGPEGAAPAVVVNKNAHSWTLSGVMFKHMYLDEVVTVELEIKVGGIGETALYVLSIRRTDEAKTLLLVSDHRGRVVHTTSALANQLGTSVSKLMAGNSSHALDALLPQPFLRIHHTYYHDKPDSIPRYSCRSGLSVFLPAMTPEGPVQRPFSLQFRRKEVIGHEPLNVVSLAERSLTEVLDERRLRLVADSHGIVTSVSNTPTALFGFNPQALVGNSLAYVIDVLRPIAGPDAGPNDLLDGEEKAAKMLMAMAEKSYAQPGTTWRVGVSPIMDPVQMISLGPIGVAMLAKRMCPAVMSVSAYMEDPELDGARMKLPTEMKLEVELWHSELVSGVLEIDSAGNIATAGVKDMPTFNPGLVLGVGGASMQGQPLSNYLSLNGKPHMEALFSEGGLGGSKTNNGKGGQPRKSLIKTSAYSRRKALGPVQHVRMRHLTDGEELEVAVQAIIKQDVGAATSVYVLMHVEAPRAGRPDFSTWIWTPAPLATTSSKSDGPRSRRGSTRRGTVDRSSAGDGSALAMSLAMTPMNGVTPRGMGPAGPGGAPMAPTPPVFARMGSSIRRRGVEFDPTAGAGYSGSGMAVAPPAPKTAGMALFGVTPGSSSPTPFQQNQEAGGEDYGAADEGETRAIPTQQLLLPAKGGGKGAAAAAKASDDEALVTPRSMESADSGRARGKGKGGAKGKGGIRTLGKGGRKGGSDDEDGSEGRDRGSDADSRDLDDLEGFEDYSNAKSRKMKPHMLDSRASSVMAVGSDLEHERSGYDDDEDGDEDDEDRRHDDVGSSDSGDEGRGKGTKWNGGKAKGKGELKTRRSDDSNQPTGPKKQASIKKSAAPAKGGRQQGQDTTLPRRANAAGEGKAGGSPQRGGAKNAEPSPGSDDEGLGPDGRQRIHTWVASNVGPANMMRDDDEDDESEMDDLDSRSSDEDDDANDNDDGGEANTEIDTEDDGADGEDLDEAGGSMNDYKRGKRFKKLTKMLASPQALGPVTRLRVVALLIMVVLVITDLLCFVTFYLRVSTQINAVQDLHSVALAADDVMQASVGIGALSVIYGGRGPEDLRHVGSTVTDRDYQLAYLEDRTTRLDGLHRGVYRGFSETRRMTTNYGLRDIWELPQLVAHMFYYTANGTRMAPQNVSLWDGGNLYIQAMRSLLQNSVGWNASGTNFSGLVDTEFVLYNGPEVLFPAYKNTLDGMVQDTISRSNDVNNVQLIILSVEGVVVCILSVVVMWIVSRAVTFRRFAVYSVFMAVPQGVVRGLATRHMDIEEREQEEEEDDNMSKDDNDYGDEEDQNGGRGATRANTVSATRFKKISLTAGTGIANAGNRGTVDEMPRTWYGALLFRVMSMLNMNKVVPQGSKRQLQPSYLAALWLVWPFILWGTFVIVMNAVGYTSLHGIAQPIATVNVAGFVLIRMHRVVFYAQQLVMTQPGGASKAAYRAVLSNEYAELRKEYDAMLYGSSAPLVKNDTSTHFRLASDGMAFSYGSDILYTYRDCMCEDQLQCQPVTSTYFRYTMYGLDQLLKQLYHEVENLLLQTDVDANLTSPHFKFIYEIGTTDSQGGLIMLNDAYMSYVDSVYKQTLSLHIVVFVISWVMAAAFSLLLLGPHINSLVGETKRVAELLSNLPSEFDVEQLVSLALKAKADDKDKDKDKEGGGDRGGSPLNYRGTRGSVDLGGPDTSVGGGRKRSSVDFDTTANGKAAFAVGMNGGGDNYSYPGGMMMNGANGKMVQMANGYGSGYGNGYGNYANGNSQPNGNGHSVMWNA